MKFAVPLALATALLAPAAGVGIRDFGIATASAHDSQVIRDARAHGAIGSTVDGRIAGTAPWMGLIDKVAGETGVPSDVLRAVMALETAGDANAHDEATGAVGLMQVSPAIPAGIDPASGDSLWDPETNVRVAARFLKGEHDRWGSWPLAAASWADRRMPADVSIYAIGFDGQSPVVAYVDAFRWMLDLLHSEQGGQTLANRALWAGISAAGTPYVYGGQSPEVGFDCSGFVWWAYQQVGVNLPRPSDAQFYSLQPIDASQAQPGDIVAFADPAWGSGITHVGLYAGNGLMLHAPREGEVVSFASIYDSYWGAHLVGFGRVAQ